MGKPSVILFTGLLVLAVFGCGSPSKLQTVQKRQLSARLALSRSEMAEERRVIRSGSRDTIRVTADEDKITFEIEKGETSKALDASLEMYVTAEV